MAGRTDFRARTTRVQDPVEEIQRTGTEYAAAMARLPEGRNGQAFEVARSTLYGAATEVSRLAPEQSDLRLTAQALDVTSRKPIDF